jgi:hypothetical protein
VSVSALQLVKVHPAGRVPVWKPLKPSETMVADGERGGKKRAQRATPIKEKKMNPFFKNSLAPTPGLYKTHPLLADKVSIIYIIYLCRRRCQAKQWKKRAAL